jgi:hypothetical protein
MNSYPIAREVEKPKPQSPDLLRALNRMDAWLSNDESIQGLSIDEVVEWREAVAKHLGVAPDSWFERMGK